jgi:hypothetical protein
MSKGTYVFIHRATVTSTFTPVFWDNLMCAWRERVRPWYPLTVRVDWCVDSDVEARTVNSWLASKDTYKTIANSR